MSQFLETPDCLSSTNSLCASLCHYTGPEFYNYIQNPTPDTYIQDGGEEWIQKTIANSKDKFRMFGSVQELAKNLKIFRQHPESSRILPNRNDPFHSSAMIYYSLNNVPYILKADLLVILQNMAFQKLPGCLRLMEIAPYIIGRAMRIQWRSIHDGRLEFVKFDHQQVFDEIEEELEQGFKTALCIDQLSLVTDLNEKKYESIAAKLGDLNPTLWNEDHKRKLIIDGLTLFERNKLEQITYAVSNCMLTICANCIETVISQRPQVFKSASPSSPTVRLFEDGERRFVLCHEIQDVLGKITTEADEWNRFVLGTYSMQAVAEKYGEKQKNVEFIRTPILRAKHRAVPIPIGDGRFAFLATDVLFEFLRSLILVHKIFQKPNVDLLQRFIQLDLFFDPERKDICLVKVDTATSLNDVVKIAFETLKNTPVNDVRNAKKDGFTVQNLKNELAHLGLLNSFPEIQNHAEIVYSEIDKRKTEQVLRTCDLFDAIEHCQLLCIFSRHPKLKKFLHNQESCHRVIGLNCSTCPPFCYNDHPKTASESKSTDPTTLRVASDDKKVSESPNEKATTSDFKKPKQKTSEAANASPESQKPATALSESSKTSEVKNPVQSTSKPSSDSKTSSETQKPPDPTKQKTSANCEKCFRACEMLNETRKELKLSENKLKNVEKKMLGKERGMEELKKDQKGKMDEKEKEIQMRTEEIQGLKKRVQEKEEENRSLKDQISKQESSGAEEEKFRQEEQLEMTQKHLKKRVSRLELELREGNENMWKLQNQMASDREQFETEILEKNREIEKLKEAEIRMKAENEVNQRMIQQLMDKLASSGFRTNSEVPTSSSRIQKCEICWNETNDREAVRCQKCRRPFHKTCSSRWREMYKNCPSCNEEFIESTNTHFSSFS